MSINLSKGQTINLKKSDGGTLANVRMGLGWDEVSTGKKKGFFSRMAASVGAGGIDLDASVIMFDASGNVFDIVYFGHLNSNDGSIHHTGDNLTGAGDGDDESIIVNLQRVPENVTDLVFTINSYSGETFSQVANAFARLVDSDNRDEELCRFNLSTSGDHTAMVMARIYRSGGGWAFKAVGEGGQGRTAQNLGQLAQKVLRQG